MFFEVQFNGEGSLCVLLAERLTLVFSMHVYNICVINLYSVMSGWSRRLANTVFDSGSIKALKSGENKSFHLSKHDY